MKRRWRSLSPGEIAMASLLFRDAIDDTRVPVYGRPYLPCLQPKNCAMAPNGSLYSHHSCFLDDYSRANFASQHWCMHEMVLFWQSAHRFSRRLRRKRTDAAAGSTSCLSSW